MFASSVWPDSVSCWLQIAAQAVLFMCMNTAGIFISYLSDRAQRQAFLETRRCVEARLRLETENQRQVLEKLSYLCMKCHWYLGKAGALSPPWLGGGAIWPGRGLREFHAVTGSWSLVSCWCLSGWQDIPKLFTGQRDELRERLVVVFSCTRRDQQLSQQLAGAEKWFFTQAGWKAEELGVSVLQTLKPVSDRRKRRKFMEEKILKHHL